MSLGKCLLPALYVHFPFCRKRCIYCDFNTYGGRSEEERFFYWQALLEDIRDTAERLKNSGLCSNIGWWGREVPPPCDVEVNVRADGCRSELGGRNTLFSQKVGHQISQHSLSMVGRSAQFSIARHIIFSFRLLVFALFLRLHQGKAEFCKFLLYLIKRLLTKVSDLHHVLFGLGRGKPVLLKLTLTSSMVFPVRPFMFGVIH